MLRRRGVRGQGHRQAARPPLVPFVSISNLDPGFFLKEYSTPNAKICEGSDEKDQVNCAFQAFESMFGMRLMRATSIIPSFKKMMPRSSPRSYGLFKMSGNSEANVCGLPQASLLEFQK